MGTLTEEIFSQRLGRRVHARDTVVAPVDYAMSHDVTSPLAIEAFRRMEMPLWDPERVVIVFDHVMPANTVAAAEMHRSIREFVVENKVRHLFQEGICHQLMVEKGFARPGGLIVGADSHSTTYGALGCFGTGLGSSDIGIVYATGRTWFRIPETLRIDLHGELPRGVDAKDIALNVIRQLGAEGANYLAVEWGGESVRAMSMAQRLTLANLSIDFGAKAGLIEADAVTREYLGGDPDMEELRPERPAYVRRLEVDVATIPPQVAVSPAIDNVQDIGLVAGTPLDEIFVGSCTNGRLEDLAIVAGYLEGRTVSGATRTIVVPASRKVYLDALRLGYVDTIISAGATVMNAGCGPCLGRQHGVVAAGERVLSTSNRNYPGRMGSPDAEIFLASPAVAAASALTGVITDPREATR
ncbi:MAG: homoaconitase large subunit [Candidatus Dormibacteria bacterium]